MTTRPGHLLFVAAAFLVAPLWATSANAHGVTLKVHHALPADSPFHTQFLVPWTQKVEKESGGRLRFRLFPALQMGGTAPQLYDQVKDGDADIVWTAAGYTPDRFPAFEVFQLPLMAHSAQGASRALWEYVRLNDLARNEFDGVRLLAVGQHDAPQFHLRSRPIQSPADLNGLKIGAPTRAASRFLAALGASPVEMSADQAPEALSTGSVDGALLPWEAVSALESGALVKYHTELAPRTPWLYSAVFVLAMNPATYKSLPDDLRKVINANSGAETSAWLGAVFDAGAASARKLAEERGDAINVLPADAIAGWQKPAQIVIEDRVAELDKRGLKGKALLESARASLAEYDPPK